MNMQDFIYKVRGINPDAKKAFVSLFNSSSTRTRGSKVLEDLMIRFHFYGAKPTTDTILLAKQAAYREVLQMPKPLGTFHPLNRSVGQRLLSNPFE